MFGNVESVPVKKDSFIATVVGIGYLPLRYEEIITDDSLGKLFAQKIWGIYIGRRKAKEWLLFNDIISSFMDRPSNTVEVNK